MLTIIVPFYDEVIYLQNALNSIKSQRIDDIQIIVVNDNPDEFDETALAALGVSDGIDLIRHPQNLGLSAARNSGLAQARGRFVGFLDSDDYYTLGGLAHQLKRAIDTDADITHAQTWYTDLGSAEVRILPRDAAYFATPGTLNGLNGAEQAQFITSSWSSLYRRDFLVENNLLFDPEQTKFEDRLFVLNTVTRAKTLTFTGRPSRVWRRRAGSISVTQTTPHTHLLQVQLLEKCLGHIRAEVTAGRLRPVFEKRELFNTVSRLIWDMDLIEAINSSDDPAYKDLGDRIAALLGSHSFGHGIFSDKTLAPISRVGMPTRKGRISRAAFFGIHRAMREGDFAAAKDQIDACNAPEVPAPASPFVRTRRPKAKRLVLHLGLHKTGTTYIQHHLTGHRDRLLENGILVPLTGFEDHQSQPRAGATPGHQGLVRALHRNAPGIWGELEREISSSGAETVVISCENMGFPTLFDRDKRILRLVDHLGGFEQTDLIVLGRRADTWIEAFYRERVANGGRLTGTGLPGFIADHAEMLCNLPALFAPFEAAFATKIRLGDFDALAGAGQLWPGFARLASLPLDLPVLEVPRYRTPDREAIRIIHLLNSLVPNAGLRTEILSAWFALHPTPAPDSSLLPPGERRALLDLWQAQSADFARERGYDPDLDAARAMLEAESWQALQSVPAAHLSELINLASQAADRLSVKDRGTKSLPDRSKAKQPGSDMSLTIRLRPWAADLVRKIQHLVRR